MIALETRHWPKEKFTIDEKAKRIQGVSVFRQQDEFSRENGAMWLAANEKIQMKMFIAGECLCNGC